jgi:hypothetical protein
MRSLDDILHDACQLSAEDRALLIEAVQNTLREDRPAQASSAMWVRSFWEDTPEYRVGVAQAISLDEIQRRQRASRPWFGRFFDEV